MARQKTQGTAVGQAAAAAILALRANDGSNTPLVDPTYPQGTLPVSAEQCGGTSEVRRSFTSFTQAANENGLSRILVGFHFRDAVNAGIKQGRKIGNRAVNLFLKPVKK